MASNQTDLDCVNDDPYTQNFPIVKLRFSLPVTITIYMIYLLPFCFGVFGNISVCLVFFQQKKLRSITNTFLMNLCLNDLIVLCVSIPMTLSSTLLENWIFGEFLCKLGHFTPTLTALVSTFTVAIIAVERWFVIVNKKKFDRHCTLITLMLLWLVSILIALPEFIARNLEGYAPSSYSYSHMDTNTSLHLTTNNPTDTINSPCPSRKTYFCVLYPGLRMRIFSYIVITVQYLVPFLFVSVSCYSISRFLKGRMKQMRVYQTYCSSSASNRKSIKEKKSKPRHTTVNLDEVTEHESTSCDDIPVRTLTNETKSNVFLTRFRNTFQNRDQYQDSIVIDKQNYRSASIVGTVLMPTGKTLSHSERRFHRSKKLLICVAALFTISWLPLTVVQIYLEHNSSILIDKPQFVYGLLLIPCYLISSLSAWMNPVIYNYINRSFRREFYALYPCCCKLTSSSSSSLLSSAGYSVTDMPSVIGKRLRRQQRKNVEEDGSFLSPHRANNSSVRFVTFADGDRKTPIIPNDEK